MFHTQLQKSNYSHLSCSARRLAGSSSVASVLEAQTSLVGSCDSFTLTSNWIGDVQFNGHAATNHDLSNQQYSITAVTTSTGSVAERYAYTAYGEPMILDASGTPLTTQTSTLNVRYMSTGREWDATLGLYHFRARWMSGVAGRFLTRDPMGLNSGENFYQLLNSRSFRSLDPSGSVTIHTTLDTLSTNECPLPNSGRTTLGMIYQFRVENNCANKSGWIIQEITAGCSSGKCRDGTCPADKYSACFKTYYEAWRVSGEFDPTVPDQEARDGYDYTGTSTVESQVQFETCGYQIALGRVRFICDEDIPNDESPSSWLTNIIIDTGAKGCPLFITGRLPTSRGRPSYWEKSKESEAIRSYEIDWNCCCDAGERWGIRQTGETKQGGR